MPTIKDWSNALPQRYYAAMSHRQNGYWAVYDSATSSGVPQCEVLPTRKEADQVCADLNEAQDQFHQNVLHSLLEQFPALATADIAKIEKL
jgi:hypothetical protein